MFLIPSSAAKRWVTTPAEVIPCHYNTFPPIEADAEAFKKDVQDAGFSQETVLEPGGSHTVI